MNMLIAIIATFLLSYYPNLFGINLIHILALVSYIYLILNFNKMMIFFRDRRFFNVLLFLLIINIYLIITSLYNNGNIIHVLPVIYLLIEVIPISLFIVLLVYKNTGENRDLKNNVFKVIIFSSLLQSILSVISYLLEPVQYFFSSQLINGDNSNVLNMMNHRLFGFSSSLTFAMPALHSVLVILIILTIKKINIKWMVIISLLIFSAAINARTSIVILLVGSILLLVFYSKNIIYRILFLTPLFFILIPIIFNVGPVDVNTNNETVEWIVTGANEIINFLQGNYETGYFAYVTDESNYMLPSGLNILFGHGIRIMGGGNKLGARSDVGYINDIWLGGIIYTMLLISFFKYIFRKMKIMLKNSDDKFYNLKPLFLILIMLVLNFKGFIFSYNSLVNIIMLMFCTLIFSEKTSHLSVN